MLFFVQCQIFLGIALHALFLIIEHISLHCHKLRDSICFESAEQMLQPIFKMLGVLVDDLRHWVSLFGQANFCI